MVGGGKWVSQNKKLNGAYINFVSKVVPKVDIGWRRFNDELTPFGTIEYTDDWYNDEDAAALMLLLQNHFVISNDEGAYMMSPYYNYVTSDGTTSTCVIIGDNTEATVLPEEYLSLLFGAETILYVSQCSNIEVKNWLLKNTTPSDAPIPDNSTIGTWILNDDATILENFKNDVALNQRVGVKFISNGREYYYMKYDDEWFTYGYLNLFTGDSDEVGHSSVGIDSKYQTITITEGATNKNFAKWLNANATQFTGDESILGTWILPEEIEPYNWIDNGRNYVVPIEFTSNGTNYTNFYFYDDWTSGAMRYDGDTVYQGYSWKNENYRTITITGGYADTRFKEWLFNNATKQSETNE